jgi:hypothetical protein
MKLLNLTAIFLVFLLSTSSWAGLVDPVVDDNQISGKIELPGGIEAELTIRFEKVVGLNLDNLGLSVQLVSPLDSSLLKRLSGLTTVSRGIGSGSLLSIPVEFPVLIRVEPPASGGLAFEGVVEVEIYTQNLVYAPGSPIRLFTAPSANAPFYDITDMLTGGSVRTRSGGGHFSDFLLVLDTRPLSSVIDEKFDRLDDLLVSHASAIAPALLTDLSDLVDQAYLAWNQGQPGVAMTKLSSFQALCDQATSLGQLSNVWRSARDISNVDGELRAQARTLRFSLSLAANLL